jgi:uncharacterized membrane protein
VTAESLPRRPWIARHWLALFNSAVGLFVLGALLAPALMRAGYTGPASVLYTLYGFTCHQLPQRSYFIFGQKLMYPLDKILSNWPEATDFFEQRAILGDPVFGYKVAIANRCSAIYSSILLVGVLFGLTRRQIKPLSLLGVLILSLPMAVDGVSHVMSEVTGLGFRSTNAWLQVLTQNAFPLDFYTGDAFGSFNWLARTVSGALFGIAVVWMLYPTFRLAFRRKPSRPAQAPGIK